ncbi:MAG: S9 family peptidase [Planctomycetota bacterium]|jgi:dipeptidyl-peptidase-4
MIRFLLPIAAGVALLATTSRLHAQSPGTLESLPGFESYETVRKAVAGVRRDGRVSSIEWSEDGAALQFKRGDDRYRLDLDSLSLELMEEVEQDDEATRPNRPAPNRSRRPRRGRQRERVKSPDGQWEAVARDWNVVIRRTDDLGGEIAVTTDGTRKRRYGQASWVYGEELRQIDAMWWSPDSARLVFYEFDEREVNDFFLVGGWSERHTEVLVEGYPKPGEPNPRATLRIFDLLSKETIAADVNVEDDHYIYNVRFTPDGSELLVNRTNRHQNVLEVLAVDPESGDARVVLTERQPCWQSNSPTMRFLADGDRFIWETERTGFRQFELRDLNGNMLAQLSRGQYPARQVHHVDEDRGVIYYTAFSGRHPLNARIHRVGLDGTGSTCLTQDDLNHELVSVSPDGHWFIARSQTLAEPPTTALFDSDGRRAAVLAETETSEIESLALQPPEMFTFKADDGRTDLYGWLYKPSDFDPARQYPLLIDVYGGPLSQGVRNSYRPAYAQTEFGFIIAKIDNRGTTGRGKAFETAAYLDLGSVDLQDQVDGVRHLAARPYIDGDRVGIFGHSYGGYMAALAILKHPDVFHVAVAGAPVTDWRNYDTIYTERFMRTPEENTEGYDAGSCLTYVDQLRGRLLIMQGMVDDNVHPNNTWQLVAALQEAGKPFDMFLFPDGGHGLGPGASSRRWLHLHQHLIASPAPVDTSPASGTGGESDAAN